MSSLFEYKGYLGDANVSIEDEVLYGKIQFIKDLISYEAKNVPDLMKAFENAVDEYIDLCKAINKN